MTKRAFFFAVALITFAAYAAEAAKIKADISISGDVLIFISGEILQGDDLIFRSLPMASTVSLDSPGGNAVTAIAIGRLLRARGYNTVASGLCASACGLIWLAGKERMIGDAGKVGFHAVYDGRTLQESGAGNALVGAYLSELALSDAAIVYITHASPTEIQWLTVDDSEKFGITWGVDISDRPAPEPGSQGQKLVDLCIKSTKDEWGEKMLAGSVIYGFCGCVSRKLLDTMTEADWAKPSPTPKESAAFQFCRRRGCQGAGWQPFCLRNRLPGTRPFGLGQ